MQHAGGPTPSSAAPAVDPDSRHIPNPYLHPPATIPPPAEIHAAARARLVDIARLLRERHDPLDHEATYDVYHGHAGLALVFFRIHESDPAFMVDHVTAAGTVKVSALALAREYTQSALTKVAAAVAEQKGRSHIGFMGSPAGVYAIAAVVLSHCGSDEESDRALDHLLAMKRHCFAHSESSEILYGRAGYLYSLLFVRHHMSEAKHLARGLPFPVTDALIEEIYNAIMEDGRMEAKRALSSGQRGSGEAIVTADTMPLVWAWHQARYLGAAHGVAGVLGVLMSVPWMMDLGGGEEVEQGPLDEDQVKRTDEITSTLAQLCDMMLPNGNFPVRVDEDPATSRQLSDADELVQFCHGSPGVIFCLLRGYEVFGDEALLECAVRASESVWARGVLKKGVGLCHGISGNALVFLSLYKHTRDPVDLYKADRFLQLCCDHQSVRKHVGGDSHGTNDGIMERGLGGVAWLACELGYWESEKEDGEGLFGRGGFPCFTAF
ncbi:hypothetical protein HK101_007933 [Irineochytrium annulatum]|nr:hypothetical protein HK101_007933 [Irineochytrium annulatum]